MMLKIDTKFEGKLTCAFKNDMRNLANFHRMKNSDFILKGKMAEVNQEKKKVQNNHIDQMQSKNFVLPWK